MALKCGDSNGKAVKNDSYTYKDGENILRLVGEVLPRYLYWVKGTDNKDVPIECLAFDRSEERFVNREHDYVREYFPDLKCSWAYVMQAIDVSTGKLVVVNLKKKLFEQIKTAAEDLGDPTDPDTGWDCVFKRAKTGPLAFNVEYTLNVLRCKNRPLTEAERALVAAMKPIDELVPRSTPEEQKKFIEEKCLGNTPTNSGSDKAPESVDDIPY